MGNTGFITNSLSLSIHLLILIVNLIINIVKKVFNFFTPLKSFKFLKAYNFKK